MLRLFFEPRHLHGDACTSGCVWMVMTFIRLLCYYLILTTFYDLLSLYTLRCVGRKQTMPHTSASLDRVLVVEGCASAYEKHVLQHAMDTYVLWKDDMTSHGAWHPSRHTRLMNSSGAMNIFIFFSSAWLRKALVYRGLCRYKYSYFISQRLSQILRK